MNKVTSFMISVAVFAACGVSAAAAGDAEKGKVVFEQCSACHMVGPGAKTKVGPQLNGIVGRRAAAVSDYPMYSSGMKVFGDLGVVWTEENLDKLIADPKAILPNSSMGLFHGVTSASDRANVIAYLKTYSN